MRRSFKSYVSVVLCLAVLLVLSLAVAVGWRSRRAMRWAAEEVRGQNEFRFAVQPVTLKPTAFETITSPATFVAAAEFQGHLYIAGDGGLLEYDESGNRMHEYAVGRELPASPLTAVTTVVLADSRLAELIVATMRDGILAFDGSSFRQILPASGEAREINAVLPTASGHLLIGTSKRGVLIYDGKRLTVFHPELDRLHVTALAGSDADLWVGTMDRGVVHFHGGRVEVIGQQQGMPDPQVLVVAVAGGSAFVGTPTGVAEFNDGRLSRVLASGVLVTALLVDDAQLFVGSEDQGVLPIALEAKRPNPNADPRTEMAEVRQLFKSGDALFAVTRNGLYRRNRRGLAWQRVLEPAAVVLSDRNISGLAADGHGNLWVGYFNRGLDVVSAGDAHVRHVEDEHVFCINRILPDAQARIVNVATANGLIRFDADGREQQVLTRQDGLIADHITDVAAYRGGLALATPAGLTFLDASGARSMYAFHGLVNNHVYALGVAGDELMAGTLGGLSRLEKGDIAASYTTANSNLKHNWITAVAAVDSGWLVGTYGAGIVRLDSSGHFHALENASGDFEVNPNAMAVTTGFVLAGTLGRGLYVMDRTSGRWSVVRDGLPSLNVTAVTSANGYIYVGTDNGLVRIPEQKLHS